MKDSFDKKKKKNNNLLSIEKEKKDLCAFCFAAPHCTLVNPIGVSVLECEEFRSYDPIQEKRGVDNCVVESVTTIEGSGSVCEKPMYLENNGLCNDCAIYDSCPFPKDRGEVWSCEEYR